MRPISAHAGASCTMRVGGRLSQVSAFLDHPGRFYDVSTSVARRTLTKNCWAVWTIRSIPTDTYTYLQYLLIVTYLQIPTIPTHFSNTCSYLQIPRNRNVPTHTYTYIQYQEYLHIPIETYMYFISAHTYNTYTYLT